MQKQQDDEGRLGVWAEEEGLLMVVRQMPLRAFERYLASAFLPCLFYIPFFFFLLFVEPFLREDINSTRRSKYVFFMALIISSLVTRNGRSLPRKWGLRARIAK